MAARVVGLESITISSDKALWEDNAFIQYVDPECEWSMSSFDRVVLLNTFLTLKTGNYWMPTQSMPFPSIHLQTSSDHCLVCDAGKVAAKWERAEGEACMTT